MGRVIISSRVGLLALCIAMLAAPAAAQEADEHAAHHPGAANASQATQPVQPAAPMPASKGPAMPGMDGMAGMSGMMDSMMEKMMGAPGGRSQDPFFSQFLTVRAVDDKARADLARMAGERAHRGLMLINEGAAAAPFAASPAEQIDAARKLREGIDLFMSGTAARRALAGGDMPADVAVTWFRDQLSIEMPVPDKHAIHAFGVSPAHLLLMLFLGLVSAGLLGLQLLRWRRIQRIVAASAVAPIGRTGPASAVRAATTASPSADATDQIGAAEPDKWLNPAGAALRRPGRWTGQLRVVQIVRETPTTQTFRFANPSAGLLPFDFLPGQFLQVEVEPEAGKPVRRSYTISSSPTQRAYVELTVKREEQGAVSRYLHDQLKVGDLIKVSGPFGAFTFTGSDADSIVLIAGGVGITPMMSVLRYLTDTAWPGDIFFLYGARSTDEFVFREEIERLERRHEKLHVFGAMQRAPGTVWHGAEGPITKEMLASAVPALARRRIHLCGPPPMMAAMKAQLMELGVPQAQIHTEAFGPASLPVETVERADPQPAATTSGPIGEAAPPATAAGVAAATITFAVSGVSAALPADRTVLEAAEEAGVEIPYACRTGECGACVTKLLDGEVTMAVESGLAPQDKADGYILACQAKSTGKPLVVEA